jgi:putative ABC transport system permease protein
VTGFALRGLLGRKLRAVLTGIAIVLGVAMISGTYILTDTIDRAFSNLFTESYAGTDAVVQGEGPDISFEGESAPNPPVEASVLETVREVPDVALATGSILDESSTKILQPDGDAVSTGGAPSFGFGIDTSQEYAQFNPLEILEGRWPSAPNEVVIDVGTADDQGYAVGDTVEIATLQPKRAFELVGVAQYGGLDSLGTATFAVFTIPTAQELLDREGQFDAISVAAKEGTSEEELVEAIAPALPVGTTVQPASLEADEAKDEIGQFTSIIRYFLLTFAAIALFVGAFVIFNTFSITVAQRTREFATLRTIGASRRQVLMSVIVESLAIGILASLIGLALGLLLAEGIQALFRTLGFELPSAERVFALRTVIVSMAVGVLVTLAAGLFPAIRATRVPPIAAVREGATLPRSRITRFVPWIAGLVVVGALLLLGRGMFVDDLGTADRLLSLAAGVLLLFIGIALVSSRVVRPVAVVTSPIGRWAAFVLTALAWPTFLLPMWLLRLAAWGPGTTGRRVLAGVGGVVLPVAGAAVAFGLSTELLPALLVPLGVVNLVVPFVVLGMWLVSLLTSWRPEWPLEFPSVIPDRVAARTGGQNTVRNPGRTASTAAALMIGIALVSFISVLAEGLKVSNREAIEEQVVSDYVVTSGDGYTPFVAGIGDALAASQVPEVVTSVRTDVAEVNGDDTGFGAIDPDTITSAYVFDWTEGDDEVLATLGTTGAIVSEDYADDHALEIGSRLRVLSVDNETADVRVVGIYDPHPFYPLLDSVTVSTELFDTLYERPRNQWLWANIPGEPSEASKAQLEEAVAGYPDAQVETREEWIEREDDDISSFLMFLYVLLALAVFISIFGMINTLVLSVYERTREIGMLRAIGMTRRQTRRMIRQESIITALIGAALGLPLGIFLAALVTRALADFNLTFSIPWTQLAILTLVAIVVGILAAITPARRAAKLDPLRAIAYE